MASAPSTRSESPVDIDFSVIRTSIQMGHKMIDQILNGIHYGSDEVRNLLRDECDFIMECKVCRNLFRSFPNFVAHKRVYCMEYYDEKVQKDGLAPVPADEETVVIQPQAPENDQTNNSEEKRNVAIANSNIEKVINRTFEGRSKEYQFYTKVAEDVEKRKVTKVTNTMTLTPIATTSKAVGVIRSKGDISAEIVQVSSPKKQSPVKTNETAKAGSPGKKKTSVLTICSDLTKKKILQGGKEQTTSTVSSVRLSTRSRKSSPRKSVDYLDNTVSGGSKTSNAEEDMDMSEWTEDIGSEDSKVANDSVSDKEWLKFCDVKNSMCKVCKKSFSSLYNLKFHAKMKHLSSVAPYACPHCDLTFDYFTTLARHLRKTHHKSESYINNVKMKLQRRKSTESMETDQDDTSSNNSSSNPPSPRKVSGNLLSYSTGWKKCDKCGKVCWKAKSFYRHYSTCKGPITKENAKSATNSPVKAGKSNNGNGGQRNSTALLKLQEKLRAGVIQPSVNVENTLKAKQKERNSKSESDLKNNARDKKTEEKDGTTYPELFKTLTRPLTSQSERPKSKQDIPTASNENTQAKTYNLRVSNQNNDHEDKAGDSVTKMDNKGMEETDKNKEVQVSIGSPAFKKLEERLVREAGLKETKKPEKIIETASKPYSTRNAAQIKGSTSDSNPSTETIGTPWKGRNLSSELDSEGDLSRVKEQRALRESPEIKQLEEKLTREALGQKKQIDEKETDESVQTEKKDEISEDSYINEKRRNVQTKEDTADLKITQPEENKESKEYERVEAKAVTKRSVSRDAELRKEKISERLREKMADQELGISENKLRLSRSMSKEKDTNEESLPDKTPEKMKLMTNLSPVSSPTRAAGLPSSPTPSVQSSSGDSYNMKFKMTVQEMAELVESASLTKFAKERKKRARTFLNTKQVKESQKVAGSLAKPMKRQVKKRNIVIRNVYGTRNKTGSDLQTQKNKNAFSVRSSTGAPDDIATGSEHENMGIGSRNKSSPKSDTSAPTESSESPESSIERQTKLKRLSREQKRLLNSAGFVEKNFYAVHSARDSSKDKSTEDSTKVRPSQDSSTERPSRDSSKDRPSRDSSKERPSRDSSKDRPSRDSSKDRPSRDSSKDRPSRDSSKDKSGEADAEKRRLAREIRRLESSQGFVDKGFHYESDSSVERDTRTSNKFSKNIETFDVIHQADKRTKIEKPKSEKSLISKGTVAAVHAPENITSITDTENVEDVLNLKEGSVEDEKLKSSVKKTVLYVGKDFTERIKSIHKRTSDVNQENENFENSNNTVIEPDDEQTHRKPNTEDVQDERAKTSRIPSVENKAKLSTRNKLNSESQNEESGAESKEKRSGSPKRNVSETSDFNEGKQISDSPKHRTRLATGSIFFDSELLKLSPTKAEKKIAELSRISEVNKGKGEKGGKFDSGLASIKKRLTLSPRKEIPGTKSQHERTRSEPQVYSLSTGVKQCQKCNKKFWKKKAYVFHMTNSPCSDKRNAKSGKKRALSLSPEDKSLAGNKGSIETGKKACNKKVRTEIGISKPVVNENNITKDQTEPKEMFDKDSFYRQRREVEDRSNYEKEYVNFINETRSKDQIELNKEDRLLKKRRSEVEEKSSNEKVSKVEKLSSGVSDNTKKKQTISKLEFNVKPKKNVEESAVENTVEDMNKLRKDLIKDKVDPVANEENNALVEKAEKPGLRADAKLDIADNTSINKRQNIPVKREEDENEIDTMCENNPTSGEKITSSENNVNSTKTLDEIPDESVYESSVMSVSDQIPGPSTSLSSVFSDESDDNGSEFSGFSEDDLKVGEQELSQLDVLEQEDLEGEPEDFEIDDDLAEVSDDIDLDDDNDANVGDFEIKPDTTAATSTKRPARKSAQNRFAHVEEIWVYKEPGKPVIEKSKGVKNREYVIDLKNPSKLHCHNTKNVDRLIDDKNLKCRQCDTPCTSISNLRRHVIRHLGWKRYKCKHCAYTCYDMSYCRQHVLRAHDEKLTSKNFSKFIIDLKKEATKKRAAKRTSTLHKSKKSITEEDANKKLKPPVGQKVNSEQTNINQGLKGSSVKDSRRNSDASDKPSMESNQVVMADFIAKSDIKKEPGVRKQTLGSEKNINMEHSQLDKARLNLVKALTDKK